MRLTTALRNEIKSYLIITLGLLINTLGWIVFLIPADITGGGVSGIAAILYFATRFPMGVSYLLINVLLILVAMRLLGATFGVKTIFFGGGTVSIVFRVSGINEAPCGS